MSDSVYGLENIIKAQEKRIEELEAENAQFHEQLKRCEWLPEGRCPNCFNVRPGGPGIRVFKPEFIGHKPGCELAVLLKGER